MRKTSTSAETVVLRWSGEYWSVPLRGRSLKLSVRGSLGTSSTSSTCTCIIRHRATARHRGHGAYGSNDPFHDMTHPPYYDVHTLYMYTHFSTCVVVAWLVQVPPSLLTPSPVSQMSHSIEDTSSATKNMPEGQWAFASIRAGSLHACCTKTVSSHRRSGRSVFCSDDHISY